MNSRERVRKILNFEVVDRPASDLGILLPRRISLNGSTSDTGRSSGINLWECPDTKVEFDQFQIPIFQCTTPQSRFSIVTGNRCIRPGSDVSVMGN